MTHTQTNVVAKKDVKLNTIASFCLVMALIIYSVMGVLFALPAPQFSKYFEAMLAMNANTLSAFMQIVHQNGHASLLFVLFVLDVIFFIHLGLFFYFKCRYYAKSITHSISQATISHYIAFIGPLSIFFDAVETGIVLFVIINPIDFPGWLVYIQTPFTLLAFLVDFIAIGWIIYCFLSLRLKKRKKKRALQYYVNQF